MYCLWLSEHMVSEHVLFPLIRVKAIYGLGARMVSDLNLYVDHLLDHCWFLCHGFGVCVIPQRAWFCFCGLVISDAFTVLWLVVVPMFGACVIPERVVYRFGACGVSDLDYYVGALVGSLLVLMPMVSEHEKHVLFYNVYVL